MERSGERSQPFVHPQTTLFNGASDFSIDGGTFMNVGGNNVTNNYGGTHGPVTFENFVSFSAQFDSSAQDPERQCHPGTRERVLRRIRDWIDNHDASEPIFWLHGPAGAGKSAIAQTISRSYPRQKVAATFFFYRSDVSRNDGNRLFTTLAHQLGISIPAFKDQTIRSLRECPDLPRKDVETQFEQLIDRPFQALNEAASQQLSFLAFIEDVFRTLNVAAFYFLAFLKTVFRALNKTAFQQSSFLAFIENLFQWLPLGAYISVVSQRPIVIIDGVDECIDEKLQRRLLDVIGNAVKVSHFPLRFLILSRPEAHIEEAINRFQSSIVNLAELDDANRDIEKYLVDEFSRIASKQDLNQTWPGQEIIHEIVCKSSGNFIYAATVIKFVDDNDNSAEPQLDIVRSVRPPKMMSPFAILDELYLEILRRQPDQEFLKRFLVLLVARILASSSYKDLHKDDAMLMHVPEKELHIKLRKMRSLLKFEPYIGLHHQSFLDFLQTPSRSHEYHVGEQGGTMRYFEVFIDSLVLYVSILIERPVYHNAGHFSPEFGNFICSNRRAFRQLAPQWQKASVHLWNRLLALPNFVSTWELLPCDKCNISNVTRDLLLQVAYHQGTTSLSFYEGAELAMNKSNTERGGVTPLGLTEMAQRAFKDLDTCLSLLLVHCETELKSSPKMVIVIMCSVLRFDPVTIAMRVRSVSDAQKLVDLISYLMDEKILRQYNPDVMRRASQLALLIFVRVPVLPRYLFLRRSNKSLRKLYRITVTDFQLLCQAAFAGNILDHSYVVPVLTIKEDGKNLGFVYGHDVDNKGLIMDWRSRSKPTPIITIQVILKVARTLQYLHTMGVALHRTFGLRNVSLDSESHPKIRCVLSISKTLSDKWRGEWSSYEDTIFTFGCLFYMVYFNIRINTWETFEYKRDIVTACPSEPEIPEHAWRLIQRCCAENPKNRPTMDEVVQEMESWQLE